MGQPGTPDNVTKPSPQAVYIPVHVTLYRETWCLLHCPRMSGLPFPGLLHILLSSFFFLKKYLFIMYTVFCPVSYTHIRAHET